jgi:hypothetical protein
MLALIIKKAIIIIISDLAKTANNPKIQKRIIDYKGQFQRKY